MFEASDIEQVGAFFDKQDIIWHEWEIPKNEPLAIACSGGIDSMALLLWAIAFTPNPIFILHFDHHTRSGESCQDAEWVKRIAIELKVPFITEKAVWMQKEKKNEVNLRNKRWVFFEKVLGDQKIKYLLQGHHADDVVETMLMCLSRGVSTEGLTTLLPKRKWNKKITIIRPFFRLSKKIILQGMKLLAEPGWREDKSNQSNHYYRNFIRNEILDPWQRYSRGSFSKQFLLTHKLVYEDATALSECANRLLIKSQDKQGNLSLDLLWVEPKAIVRRVLQKWLREKAKITELAEKHFDQWWIHWHSNRKNWTWNLRNQQKLCSYEGTLSIQSIPKKPKLYSFYFCGFPVGEVFLNQDSLNFETINLSPSQKMDVLSGRVLKNQAFLDLDLLGYSALIIRNWLPKDSYRPLNAPGHKKMQDWFVDRKIDPEKRRKLPLVFSLDGCLLWCPSFAPAHDFALNDRSKRALRLTYWDRHARI